MTPLGRFVLRGLVPALVLPVLAVVASELGSLLFPKSGLDVVVLRIALAAYLFVLLGSMTLNAWLLLRHPATLATRALPHSTAVVQLAQWVLIVACCGVLVSSDISVAIVVLGLVVAALSIVVCAQALARARNRGGGAPLTELTLSRGARVTALAYLALTTGAFAFTALSPVISATVSNSGPLVGGPAVVLPLLLGLPWSHPVFLATTVFSVGLGTDLGVLATIIGLLPLAANIVLVSIVLWSPARRVRLANWFFKIGPARKASEQGVSAP